MANSTVDVVIVNWNSGAFLASCIQSLAAPERRQPRIHRIRVVDNASSDDSLTRMSETASHLGVSVEVVRNTTNAGFAAACNQGARGCEADYILFLNPDTALWNTSLEHPTEFCDDSANRHVGICGIRMVDAHGGVLDSCYRFPTLLTFFGEMTRLSTRWPRLFPPHKLPRTETLAPCEVDQVMGSFFFVRRSAFEQLGGFDETFFMYYEEVDFCYRARQRGILTYYLPGASYYHAVGGTSRQAKAERLLYSLRSRTRYAKKHYSLAERAALLGLTVTVELAARLFAASVGRSTYTTLETVKAYSGFIRAQLTRA